MVGEQLQLGSLAISPAVIQAPMAGFTNLVFRRIVREYGGAGLMFTEMVNATGFAWLEDRRQAPERLLGVVEEPRPLGVQIWENDPQVLARVGRTLAQDYGVSVVDINFGCPVPDVAVKAQSGSYLLRDPQRVGRIVERVVRACEPVPVTAKIRLGWHAEEITAIPVAKAAESAGAKAVTVHGRTAQQFFKGAADWDRIAEIKAHLKHAALIGNGDLDSPEKVVDAFARYGVDGVMIGRAALGRPWLFHRIRCALMGLPIPADPSAEEERHCLVRHYEQLVDQFGASKGTVLVRKYACRYAHGRPGAREFRKHVAHVQSADEFREVVARYFPLADVPPVADRL